MLHKLTPVWERLFYAMAAVSFFYLTAVALYWNRTDPLAITVAAVCGLALLAGLWRLIRSDGFAALAEDPRRRRLLFTVISGVFLVLCLASALIQLEDFTGTDWDIWVIHAEAQNIARHPFPAEMQNAAYFYRFPNNAALLALFTGWYRLWLAIGGAGVDLNLAAALLAAGSLWAAQLLFYHAVRLFAGPAVVLRGGVGAGASLLRVCRHPVLRHHVPALLHRYAAVSGAAVAQQKPALGPGRGGVCRRGLPAERHLRRLGGGRGDLAGAAELWPPAPQADGAAGVRRLLLRLFRRIPGLLYAIRHLGHLFR